MSGALAAQAGRTADRIAVASAIFHLAIAVFAAWLARDNDAPTAYWLLAGFAVLGLVATLLAWASVKAGRGAWTAGVVVLGVSIGVLAGTLTSDGGLGVLAIAIPMLFIDYLLFSNAQRALNRP